MKKINVILALTILGMFTMTSCSKVQNCECIITESDGHAVSKNILIESKKKDAIEECHKMNSRKKGVYTQCTLTTN